jgi:hypothetical protein
MYTSDTYIKNTIKLVKSFTIKHDDIAIHINNELIKIYGTSILGNNPNDKSKWKYYMNICGEYHHVDNPIKITIIETGLVKDLSKELLAKYHTTKEELLKHDIFYDDLIAKYPNDELLIKGIMYDLDMEMVISVPDGYLLSYSKHYVEEQESNLISELSKYSINFLKRWHVREYGIIDNLYLASLVGTLYSKLILKTINIRYSNILTAYVHSFHITEFFRSYFDLDVEILNKSTRFWLYKNMKYIRKHLGSNQTLNIVIEKILTNNGIGIAEVELINSLPDIELLDLDDVTKPLYDKKVNLFISKPRNKYYAVSDSDSVTSYQQLYLQFNRKLVDNDLVIKDTRDINNKYLPKLDFNILHRQKTKTFKLKINKSHVVIQEVTMKLLLDNWTYLAINDNFRVIKKYIDPNTGIVYNINPKQALYMVYKLLSKINNIDNPIIRGYTCNFLINDNITLENISDNLLRTDVMDTICKKIYDNIPIVKTHVDSNGFNEYIKQLATFRSMMWNVATNTNDTLLMSDMQIIYKRLHKRVYVDFNSNKTIDEMILDENMYFTLTDTYNYKEVLIGLFELFTGYKIIDDDIEKTINKYIDITSKLSSYTIQFISDDNDLNIIPMRYNSLDTINAGIIDLRDSTFRALEEFYGMVDSKAILYSNFMDVDIDIDNTLDKTVPPIDIIMYDTTMAELDRIEVVDNNRIIAGNISSIDLYKPTILSNGNDFKENNFTIYDNNIARGLTLNNNITLVMSNDTNISTTDIITDVSNIDIVMYKPDIKSTSNNLDINEGLYSDNYVKITNVDINDLELVMSDNNIDTIVSNINNIGVNLYNPKVGGMNLNLKEVIDVDSSILDVNSNIILDNTELLITDGNDDNVLIVTVK